MIQRLGDVENNLAFAYDIGLKMPKLISLRGVPQEEARTLKAQHEEIIPGRLLRVTPYGVPVKFMRYYSEGEWYNSWCVVSDNNLIAFQRGPRVVNTGVTVFTATFSSELQKYFDAIGELLEEEDPLYEGLVYLDLYINGQDIWYMKTGFGTTPEVLYTMASGAGEDVLAYIQKLKAGDSLGFDGFAVASLLWEYPYVPGQFIHGDDVVQTENGPYMIEAGRNIAGTWKKLIHKMRDIPDVLFRTDGDVLPRRVYAHLKEHKIIQ